MELNSLPRSLSLARSRCDAVKINLEPRVQFSVLVGHKWEDFSQLIVRNAPDFDFDSELTECHSTVALSTFQFPRPHPQVFYKSQPIAQFGSDSFRSSPAGPNCDLWSEVPFVLHSER